MSFSRADLGRNCADQGASMKQWQVAQAHWPPQSPSMPGTPWSVAARISVVPAGTSTSWRSPAKVTKVTRGMVGGGRERTRKPRAPRAGPHPERTLSRGA